MCFFFGGKAIKKNVRKYSFEKLKRELEALGLSIDKDMDGRKKKYQKRTAENSDTGAEAGRSNRTECERKHDHQDHNQDRIHSARTVDILDDVKIVLADLDDFLDNEMGELECNE